MGLTFLGWANNVGDFVADLAIAKDGQSRCAFSAAFAGPPLYLLASVGLACFVTSGWVSIRIKLTFWRRKILHRTNCVFVLIVTFELTEFECSEQIEYKWWMQDFSEFFTFYFQNFSFFSLIFCFYRIRCFMRMAKKTV